MTIEEIYSNIAKRMIRNMMAHDQLSHYYRFLGLQGYARFHEHIYRKESDGYEKLNRYFIDHFNKLIPELPVEDPKVIPANWYGFKRQDVDNNTRKSSVKNGLELWVRLETDTKTLYQSMHKEMMNLGEVASALFFEEYVAAVDEELKTAEKYHLNKKMTEYNLVDIVEEQKPLHDKYKK